MLRYSVLGIFIVFAVVACGDDEVVTQDDDLQGYQADVDCFLTSQSEIIVDEFIQSVYFDNIVLDRLNQAS